MAATNGAVVQEQYSAPATTNTDGPTIEQIVWAFLEKFFEIMSKNPEKLYLFYNKKSQLVIGSEAEVAEVSAGREAIQKRIQALDFKECKVRLTNVDCQSCGDDKIVSQVIGEMIKQGSDEIKKFAQTFVLAPQPNGYYVLNDIFRYILDEEEEIAEPVVEEVAAAPAEEEVVQEQKTAPEPEAAVEEAPINDKVVTEKLEEDTEPTVLKTAKVEEEKAALVEEEKPDIEEKVETPEVVEKEVEADALVPEAPKDPSPTPFASKQATPPKPAPVVPALPAKPMSWASRAAAAAAAVAVPRPAAPAVPAQKAAAPAQRTAAPKNAAPAAAPSAAKPADKENEAPQGSEGWQTAGADAKKQSRPQQSAPLEKEGAMAYIPNVADRITPEALKAVLSTFGNLTYVDINRQKNCAFVEYATPAGYQAAAAANPHKVGEDTIRVEPRRPKTQFGPGNFAGRGGMNNRGRGGFESRGPGGQRGGRGGFPSRGGASQRGGPRGPAPAATLATSS